MFPEDGLELVLLFGLDEEQLLRDSVDSVMRRGLETVVGSWDAKDGLLSVRNLHQEVRQPAHDHLQLRLLVRTKEIRPVKECNNNVTSYKKSKALKAGVTLEAAPFRTPLQLV